MPTFRISRMPDGLGYLYGNYVADDGESVRVDVLPPLSEPRPFGVMKNDAAHASQWIVYADGEEIGRVESRTDVELAVTQKMITNNR